MHWRWVRRRRAAPSLPGFNFLRCPCCASTFDLAGRRTAGRAQRDLDIPPYRFLSDFEIEIGQR